MSELTRCNYCRLQDIKRMAKEQGSRVYVRPSNFCPKYNIGGYDIFMVPKGEKLDTSVDKDGNHGWQWVAWMMEIPDHCVC